MAFKFIVSFCALLAMANAGAIIAPVAYAAAPVITKIANPSVDAVATTHQNVVRSFGGTVSTYSKAIDTPYSSVRKTDSRITNNVYTPAVAKTVTYAAAPVVAKTVTYAAPAVAKTVTYAAAPVVAKTVSYAAPAITKTLFSPVPTVAAYAAVASPAQHLAYAQAHPAVVSHVAPAPAFVKHAIAYSPAVAVAHVNFDGFGAHWGY